MTLTEFLAARLDEDEAVARGGISGQADPENGWGYIDTGVSRGALTPHVGIIHEAVQAAHITRWHPARVLREVEAKRAIVGLAQETQESIDEEYGRSPTPPDQIPELRILAAVYADHEDYDEAWRP